MRGLRTLVESDLDRAPNAFRILRNLVCPKAQDSPTLALHRSRPAGVRLDLKGVMLASISMTRFLEMQAKSAK